MTTRFARFDLALGRRTRRLLSSTLLALVALAGCGGGGTSVAAGPEVPPAAAVDGPAWWSFARDAQHGATGAVADRRTSTASPGRRRSTSRPPRVNGALLIHYGLRRSSTLAQHRRRSGQDTAAPRARIRRSRLELGHGPTPGAQSSAATPRARVEEWCVNTAAVDPLTKSALVNSEDGYLYRWDVSTNRLTQRIQLTSGIAEAYTATVIGADGAVYAVNNAVLFSIAK